MFRYIIKNGNQYGVITTNKFFRKGDVYHNGTKEFRIVCFA